MMAVGDMLPFLVVAAICNLRADGFSLAPRRSQGMSTKLPTTFIRNTSIHLQLGEEEATATTTVSTAMSDEATRLLKEAEMMRLQAEKMDLSLTLEKIETLETKLRNKSWIEKYPDKEAELKIQLQRLNDKLLKKEDPSSSSPVTIEQTSSTGIESRGEKTISQEKKLSSHSSSGRPKASSLEPSSKSKSKIVAPPVRGFDDSDLDLYIPVALDINKMMTNSTLDERLDAFRTAPELQAHFQEKIQKLLVGPLEEMQKLENLKNDYLKSSSSVERDQLKREINQLENGIEEEGPIAYTDCVFCEDLVPLTEEGLQERIEAINALPDILVAIYKQRNKVNEDDDLALAVSIDYYEPQIQLLEQIPMLAPINEETRNEFIKGYESLPENVQERFVQSVELEAGSTSIEVLDKLLEDAPTTDEDGSMSALFKVAKAANEAAELSEYNDIDFVDRSRYLEEFFPSIGNMETEYPSLKDVETFANKVLHKKSFMVTSKPERVIGGYYIRGTNLLLDEEDGSKTAAEKLVKRITESLEKSSVADKLDFFYVLDPAPPTDEEIEMGPVSKPVIVVTTKNPDKLYKRASPLTKSITSVLAAVSTFMFSVGACALNPAISDRVDEALETAKTTGIIDLEWLSDLVFPLFLSLCAIQVVHEVAHRIVAAIYKFDLGLPNFIPSITTGVTGAITPIRSAPPSTRALFDFGIAGPAAGLIMSLALLLVGLDLTASMEMNVQLPVVPVDLVRASSLGGGLVRYYMGTGVAMPDQGPLAMVQLHPFAIAGLIGSITNSLALLPLGHTDGGRVSLAMFGRRGAFVVKLFTTLLLCVAGIVGLDDVNIFLTYVLFASIWQRELETPCRNEVDELDFPRGLVGISGAILVGLVLIPMF